ncbi:MAG: Aspartyl-tRNA synthetase [Berkelbacteria bacterium GW2011_GWA2_35_9]|uniref:Aspartate--tRNA(Asp/Asn) ligase n=1 Tax=Berkelbacteria bacterium GW2011_GWA2_35_9 TaxID=1618333 RepID=A0A0G0D7G6_9BACT|nr:MAG: Aspartyl-tRNA synthetase [Berkelbacteria bacterium GW2011_GWA2_35_9]
MNRVLTKNLNGLVGEKVTVFGWVNSKRNHGKITFLDIRDRYGIVQVVILPGNNDYEKAEKVSIESVVSVTGEVVKRPENLVNKNIISGDVEIQSEKLEVISPCDKLPFELDDTSGVLEETRLKYRYLDLRTKRMKQNLINRHKSNQFIRNYLSKKGYLEIETPLLTKSTPEGARDFLVPSRNQAGMFYALPQSPQQYKQLLQIAGIEKYFQIVRNFRDEDQRGDRQPEFTQVDIEASFVDEKNIIKLTENLVLELIKTIYPEKYLTLTPIPRLTHKEAMEKYQTDRPDLRKNKNDKNELAICWVVDFPMFEKKEDGSFGPSHHPFTAIKKEFVEDFEKQDPEKVIAQQYDLVINGNEVAGGSIRTHDVAVLKRVFEFLDHSQADIEEKFGHLLKAFKFGVPPHGGIAIGYDRLLMVLNNENNIREVIPFPKTGDGRDPLMDSPCRVDKKQLDELHITTQDRKRKK